MGKRPKDMNGELRGLSVALPNSTILQEVENFSKGSDGWRPFRFHHVNYIAHTATLLGFSATLPIMSRAATHPRAHYSRITSQAPYQEVKSSFWGFAGERFFKKASSPKQKIFLSTFTK